MSKGKKGRGSNNSGLTGESQKFSENAKKLRERAEKQEEQSSWIDGIVGMFDLSVEDTIDQDFQRQDSGSLAASAKTFSENAARLNASLKRENENLEMEAEKSLAKPLIDLNDKFKKAMDDLKKDNKDLKLIGDIKAGGTEALLENMQAKAQFNVLKDMTKAYFNFYYKYHNSDNIYIKQALRDMKIDLINEWKEFGAKHSARGQEQISSQIDTQFNYLEQKLSSGELKPKGALDYFIDAIKKFLGLESKITDIAMGTRKGNEVVVDKADPSKHYNKLADILSGENLSKLAGVKEDHSQGIGVSTGGNKPKGPRER